MLKFNLNFTKKNVRIDRTDSSGIRFYMGNKHRQHELGYLSLGTASNAAGLAIPPHTERFIIDSYCPSNATNVTC